MYIGLLTSLFRIIVLYMEKQRDASAGTRVGVMDALGKHARQALFETAMNFNNIVRSRQKDIREMEKCMFFCVYKESPVS